jgi:hypothetical protein
MKQMCRCATARLACLTGFFQTRPACNPNGDSLSPSLDRRKEAANLRASSNDETYMSKTANNLMESLIAIAAFVGMVVIAFWVLESLFGRPNNQPDMRLALREKDERIGQLSAEKEELAVSNAELAIENARLRRLLHWWNLTKEFATRLVARFLAECAKQLVGVVMKFA